MLMVDKSSKIKKAAAKKKPAGVKKERYFEAVGRRKTAIARVRLFSKPGDFLINDKDYKKYFPLPGYQIKALSPLEALKIKERVGLSAKVKGGGLNAQAEAVRHGLARALLLFNPIFRKRLKNLGYLTRDPRMVERKKYGLKKARRAPQWQKR